MILEMYSIKDIYADYLTPWFCQNDALAIRMFKNLVNDKSTAIGINPECYHLCHIGSFNTDLGTFDSLPDPDFVCNALSLVDKEVLLDGQSK